MKTSHFRSGVVIAAAMFLAAGLAGAQRAGALPDPRGVPELQAEFSRAEKLGLPADALVATARLGALLHMSPKQIRDAVRNHANRIDRAKTALQPARPAEMLAGADAIQVGVPARVLRSLRAAARARSIEVPLGVLTELVSRGVSVSKAAETVETMLKRDALDGQLLALGRDVNGDVAAGVAPTVALDIRSQSVLSLLPAPGQAATVAPNRNPPPPR